MKLSDRFEIYVPARLKRDVPLRTLVDAGDGLVINDPSGCGRFWPNVRYHHAIRQTGCRRNRNWYYLSYIGTAFASEILSLIELFGSGGAKWRYPSSMKSTSQN